MFQKIEVPFWLGESGTLLNTHLGLVLVNVAFQIGFCTFVLSNFMKALPEEIYESAMVDGTSLWAQFWRLTLPLCRPSLAALATSETTWIYNEFFWATVLPQNGDKFPITSSLTTLAGAFFSDNNLVSAGSIIIALPTLVIYFALQKHCVAGLTMGATKG
ncbi:MAG: carbohydrate ABC transporter permease [Luteococcus sp.]|uniref:carbohydrate ABC transporter permease n=1 Tax=Luteococcus sp. TaxID=1969402 RepID=UPI0026484900|nr:carbohydrate ABC transporter permease [Luteococcus sp.]MDN5564897.1 carbohydrate ABC transporter permease [Luteococcus sp.]